MKRNHELLEALQNLIHAIEHEGEIHGRITGALEYAKQIASKDTKG